MQGILQSSRGAFQGFRVAAFRVFFWGQISSLVFKLVMTISIF